MTDTASTHDVFNQTPPFTDVNLAALDQALLDALKSAGVDAIGNGLLSFGESCGTAERLDLGRLANENPPRLRTHDAQGRRIDTIEFHPAYHALMEAGVEAGLHASTWDAGSNGRAHQSMNGSSHIGSAAGSHVARAARLFITAQVESGHVCPLTMTHASLAAIGASPERLRDWLPMVRSRHYDPRFVPFWEKRGVTVGMGMTEKQGGTDVRANTTRAVPASGDEYEITGHKWFMSAPMCDAFLVLAQAPGGLTCFLLPRFRPDGNVNALHLQRLKDKLGNRSNASSEAEFHKAFAWRIGEEGKGVRTIIEMVQLTRLDCVVASAGLMRMGLALAMHHARHRSVMQRKLVDQPVMAAVLSDLALESEAATALALRLAASFDHAAENPREAARARILTPAAKFLVCKAAPAFLYETMECLGGNGYVEESPMPRLYREAPVNAIWEGSGNVMALDVLRAAERDAEAMASVLVTLGEDVADLPGARHALADVEAMLAGSEREPNARRIAETLALVAAAGALACSAPSPIAEAFARTRLATPRRGFGANDLADSGGLLLGRALPLL
ncbi:acyl-CoA dehydrogenase family protein [Chelatococcus sp. XZ-Ab1]|uniref:acyl-CoA dehydrogenase family protein n=1 Tax=Chelatococcus sp. XZ-Ab1 TaxID=3034027 RepID=UPI0023E39737|nr:acyl-CoA dehydrogenase family protein [Chelatococcus sp. XZ-Ab1]